MNKQILKKCWPLVLGVGCFSALAAVMETLSLAVMAPLLSTTSTAVGQNLPFPFNQGALYLNQLSLGDKLRTIAVIVLAATVIKNIFVYGNAVCCAGLRAGVTKAYRMACVERAMHTGIGYFNSRRASDLQQVMDNHIDNSLGMMVESVVSIQPYVFTLMVLVCYLLAMSIPLTILSLVMAALATLALSVQARAIERRGKAVVEIRYSFTQTLHNILYGMKTLRLFGREKLMKDEFEGKVDELNHLSSRLMRLQAMMPPAFEICGVFILSVILFAAAWMAAKDAAAYSMLLIFILIWMRLIPTVKAINSTKAAVTARIPMVKEINRFLSETKDETIRNGQQVFQSFNRALEFSHVSFAYAKHSPLVLKDIHLTIQKGMRVGIVGASGSGKSSLAELLLRFYDPQEGRILVDGVDLKDLETGSWRKVIGVVAQDTFLLNDTIAANIAFANAAATPEMVEKAARRAHAHDFILQLPQGYQTKVGDRGVLISGGQRQRIAMARAILNEPQILLFDEATSALDSVSERYIQEAIAEISQGKTVIAIAHRLATVSGYDYIIVMDNGQVIEAGHPAELLTQESRYKQMVAMQATGSLT